METRPQIPPPYNREIFTSGDPIALIDGRSEDIELWVKSVATKAEARVDWHYSGGVAQVLHLGDTASRERVEAAINELQGALDGRIMRRCKPGERGLYRNGIDARPDGAIAGFANPSSGTTTFIVDD